VRPDGVVRWKLCEGVLDRDADGVPVRMWGTAQDVTEQREAAGARQALEDQLREAHRLESIGVLAGGIAHEFNNMLTTILGHTELAEMELPPNAPGRTHLLPIRRAADRAAELCRKMLAYAGRGRVVVSQLDFNEIVREVIVRVGNGDRLAIELAQSPMMIGGDAEQLRQLVANLIDNAIETGCSHIGVATRREQVDSAVASRLRLTSGLAPGEYILFEVSDNGDGMESATLSRAFEPFYSTKFPGRGLGLAVVLGVVRTHNGGMEVDSRRGIGTTVRVFLPASC
jgi:signal transduction histidine kinase